MAVEMSLAPKTEDKSRIVVCGVGNAGCNAVDHFYEHMKHQMGVDGSTTFAGEGCEIECIIADTDKALLSKRNAHQKIQLGAAGRGTGGKPERGKEIAEAMRDVFRDKLHGAELLVLATGLGGGTGSGVSPVIASVAHDLGIRVVAIANTPYTKEGAKTKLASAALEALKPHVNMWFSFGNDDIQKAFPEIGGGVLTLMKKADSVLCDTTLALFSIGTDETQTLRVDMEDVYSALENEGMGIVGIASARGEDRVARALTKAMESPLCPNIDWTSAASILFCVTTNSAHEIQSEELDYINKIVSSGRGSDAQGKYGLGFDDSLTEDELKIIIIATGMSEIVRQEVDLRVVNGHPMDNSEFNIEGIVRSPTPMPHKLTTSDIQKDPSLLSRLNSPIYQQD